MSDETGPGPRSEPGARPRLTLTQPPHATPAQHPRLALTLVLAASLALSLGLAVTIPLIDPDEGRNAEVSREMAAGGDFVIPHLAGMPYLDKPPALYWAAALAIRAIGHTPLAARLPSIIASLVTLWLFGLAARRAGGERFALIAIALLATAPLYAALSAYVIFDMPLTLCVSIVWLGASRAATPAPRTVERLLIFGAIAAGLLLKGPVMLAWALGGSLCAALLARSRDSLNWAAWMPGWILALGTPGAWFALTSARFPEYPHYALIEETFERVTSGSFHRNQPWWFVPAVLVGGTLPWSLATPWSRARFSRSDPRVAHTARVGLGFVVFSGVFFTLSHSKLVTYLLPALPPLAWTAAAMWADRAPRRRAMAMLALLALALTAALVVIALRYPASERGKLSGAPLARAIADVGGDAVRYEDCYSAGTDFLLARSSQLVSTRGVETTSNYLIRYRETLRAHGLWTAFDRPPAGGASIVVRQVRSTKPPPAGGTEFYRDSRFVAFRIADRGAATGQPPAR
ncbi:MAG: glycosyltransferase family 39 protein [Candidatus Eisenbacteria bacterium]|nr:glycosyltransferase family 39 protein [Candidatus Eisenbacteria bacterium]